MTFMQDQWSLCELLGEHFGVVGKNSIAPKPNAFGRFLAFKQLEG
jgi:hypothetical protein